MSDTVTIHNGHCSYHGPANKAPVWAARGAITDLQPPAPTMSLQIDPGPVPAQRVPDDASIAPELCGVGAHESHATRNENALVLEKKLSAPGSVHTRSENASSGQSASEKPPRVGNTTPVPAHLTNFEDTIHAWEEGYRAGCAAGLCWNRTADGTPRKPGLRDYEQVECLIMLPNGNIEIALWNCEHLVWDDEHGDDYRHDAGYPTHWFALAPLRTAVALRTLESKA